MIFCTDIYPNIYLLFIVILKLLLFLQMGFQIFKTLRSANKSGSSDGPLLTSHSQFNAHLSTDQHRAGFR